MDENWALYQGTTLVVSKITENTTGFKPLRASFYQRTTKSRGGKKRTSAAQQAAGKARSLKGTGFSPYVTALNQRGFSR
jgi:hypothetical protein